MADFPDEVFPEFEPEEQNEDEHGTKLKSVPFQDRHVIQDDLRN